MPSPYFPHVSRLIYGGSNKYVIPSSGILGATFLVICNDIAHVLVFGEVIPIGIITGIIGVPFKYLVGGNCFDTYPPNENLTNVTDYPTMSIPRNVVWFSMRDMLVPVPEERNM